MDILRTLRTVRYLTPAQVASRLTRPFLRPPVLWPEAASYVLNDRAPVLPAQCGARRVSDDSFRFLNVSHRLSGSDRWAPVGVPRLWAYQLHYFRWIWEIPPNQAGDAIADWLARHPPLCRPGWEPYPIAIRIREWIEWLLANRDTPLELRGRMVASLAHQVCVLLAQIEYHLRGNHLLENAIALCWAGFSLRGPSSDRWVQTGARLLRKELETQVLGDGTHDERSPMYQCAIAEALLRLAEVAAASPGGEAVRTAANRAGMALAASLRHLTHPDGEIALLNDAALGEAPTLEHLAHRFSLASSLRDALDGPWALAQAGYFGLRSADRYLVFDAGPIGPDHQPGHGHADALSFELSHRGRRLLTDTGVLTYEPGERRSHDRGTAAHNTVEVDGRDQSELWAAFRCGRRVRSVAGSIAETERGLKLFGTYCGHASGMPLCHARSCQADSSGLSFADALQAPGRHEAMLRLHFAPGLSLSASEGGIRVLESGHAVALVRGSDFEWTIEESRYHPEFGREVLRPCLVARLPFSERLAASWAIRLM